MSYRDWETDIEFFEATESGLALTSSHRFKELSIKGIASSRKICYEASKSRQVSLKIMGFTASRPVVHAYIKQEELTDLSRRGVLLGCVHPEEPKHLIPDVVRTFYVPVLGDVTDASAQQLLPSPIRYLRVSR